MSEKVSVIIPVYKVEKYLNRCVESVVNQTYQDLEIILVDDGSPDNCPRICDEWAEKDKRIKVIHKENAGIGMARNSGIEIATGEYLMFVDSDDYLSENAIRALYERIIRDKSDIAVGKHVDVYEDETVDDSFCRWMKDSVLTKIEVFHQMGEKNRLTVTAWMKLYKKDIFMNLRYPRLTCGEDCWLFPSIIEKCERISIVNENGYFYYQRPDSILHEITDKQLLDDIYANLCFSKYLLTNKFLKAAQKWYRVGLDKAVRLKNKKTAFMTFDKIFTCAERKELMSGADIGMRLKWASLFIPFLFPIMKWMKRKMRRIHLC